MTNAMPLADIFRAMESDRKIECVLRENWI